MARKKQRQKKGNRRQPKARPGDYVKEIIKPLEEIVAISGHRPGQVFSDFLNLTEATLRQLPDQVKAVGKTGAFAEDPPEIAERVKSVVDRYRMSHHKDLDRRVWPLFGQAFTLLLDSAAPGLWGCPNSLDAAGISGPDVLGGVYQSWAMGSQKRHNGSFFTPWSLARTIAQLSLSDKEGGIERMCHNAVKKALLHPDNILGQATLLAGMVLPDNDPQGTWDYYINKIVPFALPYLKPITVSDPTCGSSIMLLAAASKSPEWAVKTGICQFYGQDIDLDAVLISRANVFLYGLNGHHAILTAAAMEAMVAYRERTGKELASPSPVDTCPAKSPTRGSGDLSRRIIKNVYLDIDRPHPPVNGTNGTSSFEAMFAPAGRRQRQPAAVYSA